MTNKLNSWEQTQSRAQAAAPSQESANESKLGWKEITTSRAWRHTIGRISCLIRVPFYAIATIAQAGIMILKVPVVILTAGQLYRLGRVGEKLTFKALARDSIGLISLVDRTANTILCTVCAPPKKYRSLSKALKDAGKIVVLENYHYAKGIKGEIHVHPVSEVFSVFRNKRAQFHKQIIQGPNIVNDKIRCSKIATERVLAG